MALHEDDAEVYANLGLQGWMFDRPVDPPGTVDLFFRDNREFRFQGHAGTLVLETRHTPGHSPGSCCFFTSSMEAPVCFTGDTLFRRSIGRTDLPGGDPGRIVPSIRARLLNLPPETVVYPGHGPITTIGEERLENPFMTA
jgi:glyoxylase-like metal-dependent hydrolase (beta-lactamase superfamily II)